MTHPPGVHPALNFVNPIWFPVHEITPPRERDRLPAADGGNGRWLTLVAGADEVALKALHAEVLDLTRSLKNDISDPMEDLLAQRVGMLWLQMHYFDVTVAEATTRTPREQEFLVRRQTATEKAYAEAILTLRDFQAGVRTKLGRRTSKK